MKVQEQVSCLLQSRDVGIASMRTFDHQTEVVRRRVRSSPFNLCILCAQLLYLGPRKVDHNDPSEVDRAITQMEYHIRKLNL